MRLGSGPSEGDEKWLEADAADPEPERAGSRTSPGWRYGIAMPALRSTLCDVVIGVASKCHTFIKFVSFEISWQTELKNAEWHFSA
ncbi:hypothetical protein LJR296_005298 [Cupriavidus necator]|jgi:hypothetical protein|uniref:hypothetical protein n=1 Tax=Cupriavidus necator TaxID=106590 RepID=UPI003ECEADB4